MLDNVKQRDRERRRARRERRAREKQQRRQSIVDAARSIFSQNGFASTTMDDIAAEAEVSKGTLYLYFDSKEELLANLLLEGLDMLLIALEDEGQPQETVSASQQIRNLAQIYINLSETHPNYLRLMMAFDCGHLSETIPPELNEAVMERSSQCLKILEGTVRLGIERGEFAVEDPWEAAGILWAAFTGVIIMMAHPVSPQVLAIGKDKMFNDTIDLLLRALKQGAVEG